MQLFKLVPRGWKNGGKSPTAGPGMFFGHKEKFLDRVKILPNKLE